MSLSPVDGAVFSANWPVHPRVRCLRTAAEVRSDLDALWARLSPACDSPFRLPAWTQVAAETLAPGRRLRLVAIDDPAAPAMLPLVRRLDRGPRLEMLSSRELFEPLDAAYLDAAGAEALAEVLLTFKLPVLLRRLPAESLLVRALAAPVRGGRVDLRLAPGSPSLEIGEPIDPEARLSARRRGDLRRARRLAQPLGAVTSDIAEPTPAGLAPLLDEALAIEAAGWKGQSGTALLLDAARGAFYRRFAAAAARLGMLRLAFLRIGGTAAAMQLLVEQAERLWLLKIGYDPAFGRCSPGLLLMAEVIRYAGARGLRSVEFLGVDEPWLRPWTPVIRPCVSIRIHPSGPVGSLTRFVWT